MALRMLERDGRPEHIAESVALLVKLEEVLKRLGPGKLGKTVHEVVLFELSLTILTVAHRYPQFFHTDTNLRYLRYIFALSICNRDVPFISKPYRLPPIYWICFLWGSIQKSLDRVEEAMAALVSLSDNMEKYCQRLPESHAIRTLQAIVAHNLCIEYLESHDIACALTWADTLMEISATSHVQMPHQCKRIIDWAESYPRKSA